MKGRKDAGPDYQKPTMVGRLFRHWGQLGTNRGRNQTRIFADEFTKSLEIDRFKNFLLLDVGCDLGDAIKHFSEVFPNASLHGIDFSKTAIERCRSELKNIGHFDVSDIDSIEGNYDIIYCSNTHEHFPDYDCKARKLVRHSARLCILVPYKELREGHPLSPCALEHHQHTFDLHSLDFLIHEGLVKSLKTFIFSCRGAWGWERWKRRKETIKNVFRPLLDRQKAIEPLQIFYDIMIGEKRFFPAGIKLDSIGSGELSRVFLGKRKGHLN